MPILSNDLVDDPLIYDGETSFAGGVVSHLKPSLLVPGQMSEAVNMDLNRSGRIVTRLGTDRMGEPPDDAVVRGLFYYDWTNDFLVRASDGSLKTWDSSSWATISGFTASDSFPVEMCQLQGTLYATNGTNVYYWNGSGSAAVVADADAPACRFLVTHSGRVVAGGLGAKDNIQWSATLSASGATDWDANATFAVGGGDGEGVTGLCSWQDFRLLVFKRNSTYVVNADPTVTPSSTTWSVETVSRRIGCVSHRTIQQVGNDVFFLSEDGVRTLGRTLSDNQVGVSDPISEPIQDIVNRINFAFIEQASSIYYRNRYMLSVPLDSSTTPNYVLVYNRLTGSWSGYWTGWEATCFAKTNFGGTPKVAFGQTDGTVMEWLGWKSESDATQANYTDNGVYYPSYITTRGFYFGDYLSPKTGYSYDVEFHSSSSSVTCHLIMDRGSLDPAYSGPTRRSVLVLPLDLPFMLPANGSLRVARDMGKYGQFFSAQFRVKAVFGKIAVQGFGLSAFLDTIVNES